MVGLRGWVEELPETVLQVQALQNLLGLLEVALGSWEVAVAVAVVAAAAVAAMDLRVQNPSQVVVGLG